MNTTMLNYPSFQTLPKGVKQMFLASQPPGKRPLTFGDFVAGVYHAWGERRAKGIVQLALKAHVIEFRGTERFVIS
jgi:hypothetical protein